jgi:hypothetical protein
MFRPCWVIFRENSLDTLWLRLYRRWTVHDTSETEDETQGTFTLNCINATIVYPDYSP